jgi:apolipoprotein N-acyltransferase
VLGTPGISLVLALSAGWLLALRYARGWHREGLVLLLVALWAGAYALTDRQWTRVDGEPLSVSLIQGALPQHARWSMEQRGRSVAHYLALTEDEWGRDLILWPENALPLFHHEVEKLRAELGERAAASGSTLLTGMPYMELDTWRYFNAVVALPEPSPRYYKHHLVPFTEYLPMKRALAGLVDFFQVPMSDFSHGPEGQPPMELAGLPVGATVCYEAAYPSEVLGPLPEARLLVNISNDGWFGNSLAPHQHLQIARLRALEAGRWLLRATNTGISALIAPDGSVTARTPQFETTVLRGEVTPMAGATPYVRWRDWPVAALILVIAALGVWSARRGTARE